MPAKTQSSTQIIPTTPKQHQQQQQQQQQQEQQQQKKKKNRRGFAQQQQQQRQHYEGHEEQKGQGKKNKRGKEGGLLMLYENLISYYFPFCSFSSFSPSSSSYFPSSYFPSSYFPSSYFPSSYFPSSYFPSSYFPSFSSSSLSPLSPLSPSSSSSFSSFNFPSSLSSSFSSSSESMSSLGEKLASLYFLRSSHDIRKDLDDLRDATSHIYDWTDDQDLLYPPCFSRRMFCTSFLISIPSIVGYFYGLNDLALGCFIVFLTSLNFWRRPTMGFRRNIDIFCSVTTIWYHLYVSIMETPLPIQIFYILVIVTGTTSYIQSGRFRARANLHLDSFFHCMLHFSGVIGNPLLYYLLVNFGTRSPSVASSLSSLSWSNFASSVY